MDQRIACGHELIELGERTGQDVFSIVGRQQLYWCYLQLGDRAAMTRWGNASARLVRGPDLEQLTFRICVALLDGELDRADEITDEMTRSEGAHPRYSKALRVDIGNLRGQLAGPNVLRAVIASRPAERALLEPVLARVLARTGRTDEAARLIGDIRGRGYLPPTSPRWAITMSCLSEAAALCGDLDVAADVARTRTLQSVSRPSLKPVED
jgi:hypothetical protein